MPTLNGSRCEPCNRGWRKATRNPVYATREWMERSKRELAAWRRRYGDWCPGYRRPAHQTADLTLDHVVPLALGGAPDGPTQVLCRSCNTRKRHVETPSHR
jgi:5-methylcytosine-specific restriction protein A